MNSPVAPAGVFSREAQDEDSDAADGGRSAGLSGARCPAVATAQQVVVPAQDGVGGDVQTELSQCWSGDGVEQGCEERPVGVSRGLSTWRCRTASWWRSVRISMSLSALLIASNRRNLIMQVMER